MRHKAACSMRMREVCGSVTLQAVSPSWVKGQVPNENNASPLPAADDHTSSLPSAIHHVYIQNSRLRL